MIELGIAPVAAAPIEERADYSDLLVDAIMRRAVSGEAIVNASLGAVQVSAGLIARALTSAIPSGDMGLLKPATLYEIGADLTRAGESVWLLRVSPSGSAKLLRCAETVVSGGPDPSTWRYRLTVPAPSQQTSVEVGAESVAHFRINCQARTPYIGRSPLELAAATGQLARALSGSLGDESGVSAVSRVMAITTRNVGEATTQRAQERQSRIRVDGKRLPLPETSRKAAIGDRAKDTAPHPRLGEAERIGFAAPTAAVELYQLLLLGGGRGRWDSVGVDAGQRRGRTWTARSESAIPIHDGRAFGLAYLGRARARS